MNCQRIKTAFVRVFMFKFLMDRTKPKLIPNPGQQHFS